MSDGIHPNDAGFTRVAANLAVWITIPEPRAGNLSLQMMGAAIPMGNPALQMQGVPEPCGIALAAIVFLLRLPRRFGAMA